MFSHLYLHLKKTLTQSIISRFRGSGEIMEIQNSDIVYLKMKNTRHHLAIEAVEFYKDNYIKVIYWSPDLYPV